MLRNVKLENFAVFRKNDIEFSSGINVFIGKNSTGKSLLMKILYSTINTLKEHGKEKSKEKVGYELSKKIRNVFLIDKVGKLTTRIKGTQKTQVYMDLNKVHIGFEFSTRSEKVGIRELKMEEETLKGAVYIPTKEIISLMDRGFIGLYHQYRFMEEIYYDLAKKLDKPLQKGRYDKTTDELLKKINLEDLRRIYRKENEFYTYIKGIGNLESKLVAEGYRKLMMIIYLIKNGEFGESKYLFWDEPEVNLNPYLSKSVVELLIFLARELKIQIFVATHDYFIVKYFDLKYKERKNFNLSFFSLYFDEGNNLRIEKSEDLYKLKHNSIIEEFEEIYKYDAKLLKEV